MLGKARSHLKFNRFINNGCTGFGFLTENINTYRGGATPPHHSKNKKKMKNITTLLLLIAIAHGIHAQTQKRDTVVLSVYNNNQRFMLYPMPFGKDKPDADFTAPMVVSLDTIHIIEVSTKKDSTGKYPKRLVTQRQCGKLPKDSLTGKVAVLYMSAGCDVSTQVYNAQKAGAIAAIVIHTTDNRDSVELPKASTTLRYADDSKVKIPCFTVRKGIGERLTAMLPSLVGIQRPKVDVTNPQASVIANTAATNIAATQAKQDALNPDEQAQNTALSSPFKGIGWAIAPNPARDEVVINYNFKQTSTINIEVFNELGQIMTSYQLPDTQTGHLNLDVSAWHNGHYNISLRNGHVKEVKKLLVMH